MIPYPILYLVTMTKNDSRVWTYSNSKNCYVASGKDYTAYPPLSSRKPHVTNKKANKKSIGATKEVESEKLKSTYKKGKVTDLSIIDILKTPVNNVIVKKEKEEHKTSSNQKIERTPPPTPELNTHSLRIRSTIFKPLKLCSPIKSPLYKKKRTNRHHERCCNCSKTSRCLTSRCPCKAEDIDCVSCPSYICRNGTGINKCPVNLSDAKTPPKTKRNKQRTLTTLASTFSPTQVRLNSLDTIKSTLNPENCSIA